jgi:hypothetical protein
MRGHNILVELVNLYIYTKQLVANDCRFLDKNKKTDPMLPRPL